MVSGAFVKIITQNFFKQTKKKRNKTPELCNLEFLVKLKFLSYVTGEFCVMNKDKISELRKSEIYFHYKFRVRKNWL